MYFFPFLTRGSFFYVTTFVLRVSGLGSDVFFCLFFDLRLLFLRYCLWFKAVGLKLLWIFFLFRQEASSSMLLPLV